MERIAYGSLGESETTMVSVGRNERVVLASVVLSNVVEADVSFHCYVSIAPAAFHISARNMILGAGDTLVLQFPVALESRDALVGYCSSPGAIRYYITGTIENVIQKPS